MGSGVVTRTGVSTMHKMSGSKTLAASSSGSKTTASAAGLKENISAEKLAVAKAAVSATSAGKPRSSR